MATVKCSAQNLAEQLKYCDSHQPYLLPFSINSVLCSPDQSQWWIAVNKIKSIPSRFLFCVTFVPKHCILFHLFFNAA